VQSLFKGHCGRIEGSPGQNDLTVGMLNDKLDELVAKEDRDGKVEVLRWLVDHTTPVMMKWICYIILKDVRVRTLCHEFVSL
jgi:hypothetical protein